ncbi:MAG: hypothetical protein GYB68_15780, partial [Chloroflexi bacterium]|nr:hypothetical protein [Chloroflexota bacterium]
EDYAERRYRLVAQGVDLLQQLDALPLPMPSDALPDDPIERLISHFRRSTKLAPTQLADASSPSTPVIPTEETQATP